MTWSNTYFIIFIHHEPFSFLENTAHEVRLKAYLQVFQKYNFEITQTLALKNIYKKKMNTLNQMKLLKYTHEKVLFQIKTEIGL